MTAKEAHDDFMLALEELRDNLNDQGYSIAATQLDGLLDDYYSELEQMENNQ